MYTAPRWNRILIARRRLAFMAMAGRGIDKDDAQVNAGCCRMPGGDGESAMELATLT